MEPRQTSKGKYAASTQFLLITALAAVITLSHFFIFERLPPNIVLEELYYIPIFLGAFSFGLRGAILTYMIVSAFYLPFFSAHWSPTFIAVMDRSLHLVFTGIFGLITGSMVDRAKKVQQELAREKFLADIGQIVTSIVHDLKNPVMTILGFAKRIRDGKGDIQKSAQAVIDSANGIERLIHDLLDFSKPSLLNKEAVDARSIINSALDTCKAKGEDRGVQISTEMPDREITVAIDSLQMQRALVNLIDNAIDASPSGKTVLIRLVSEKDSAVIIVKDQGEGMDDDTLENVFVPFSTRKSSGTGLGLPIAKKIIEGHGGRIDIKSHPGAGSEASVYLPFG